MTRKAYHRLILSDGSVLPMQVVEWDAGRLVGFHTLRAEEPFVEWVGGTFSLLENEIDSKNQADEGGNVIPVEGLALEQETDDDGEDGQ